MKYLHTMVRVKDIDASLDFYCTKLGLKEVRRVENEKGRFTLIFLSAENSDLKTGLLELTYNWDPEEYLGGRNFGHLAYSVKDIYAVCDKLMKNGEEVICLDNYFTGRKDNLINWISHPKFELIRHDVTNPINLEIDRIWHLACPASPKSYQLNPIKTSKTSFLGTYNMLGLARRVKAKFLMASFFE